MKYKSEYLRLKAERDALLAFSYQCIDDMKCAARIEAIIKKGLIREEELRAILGKDDNAYGRPTKR